MCMVMKIMAITAEEIESTNPDLTRDSEQPSLPLPGPAIEAARALFTPEDSIPDSGRSISDHLISDHSISERSDSEHPDSEDNRSDDIMKIIRSYVKDVKKRKTKWAIKAYTQLTGVSEYVKLRARYRKHKACKRPCLSASLAIARQMGKGPYFARQIRSNELYLLRHHCLPPPKSYTRHGHYTLLDNEAILHDVRVYLAAQALGTVTPRTFCDHVNKVILPALEINSTISESTAQRWLRFKLGYQSKEAKKGIYIDGHERPDVVKERQEFVNLIFDEYERLVGRARCPGICSHSTID